MILKSQPTSNRDSISDLNRSLIEIVWHFGPKGLNGECCGNLSMPEFLALDKIANTPDCPVNQIGHLLGFTKSGATRIVNRLSKKGYVQKMRSHEDARVCCVHITPQGKKVLNATDERYSVEIKRLQSKMPASEARKMTSLFTKIANIIKE